MCGIYGRLELAAPRIAPSDADLRAVGAIHHRGPDDEGWWYGSRVFLGMRRLSVIDLATRLLATFPEILRQRSELLGEGRDALVRAVREELPNWGVPDVHGGVSLWLELDAPLSSSLVLAARSRGVLLSAGPRFSIEGGHDRHLRVPFTAPPDELTRAVHALADVWRTVVAEAPSGLLDRVGALV